jgi:two-component system NarL family sensor kinase
MGAGGKDGGAALALAILRATLVVVIFISERLVDGPRLAHLQFYLVLGLAAGYAVSGIVVAVAAPDGPAARTLMHLQPACDVFFLAALTYTSGGAFSDARKAFFVIPLAAAFSERPRLTANWSLLAVAVFTFVAVIAGGHPYGGKDNWRLNTFDQDLYLGWSGAAATMLAIALRRRTAHTTDLARSRLRLVARAIESVERERTRLAGALHDSPVQNLIAARHDLRRAERTGDRESFRRLHEALDATIAELREEIFNLHPHVLDHVGLSAALEQVARRHADRGRAAIIIDVTTDEAGVDREMLFALGRELLGNAAKHAHATEIRLAVTREPNSVTLLVADNGRGIPDGRVPQALLDGHVGLASVSERVEAVGGTLNVATAIGEGTIVRITLPVMEIDRRRPDVPVAREVSDRVTLGDALRVSPT